MLCVLCVLFGVVLSQAIYIIMASGQFKQRVHPCPRFLTGGDTHQLCVHCLGAQHARATLEGAACVDCEALRIRVLCSHLAVFDAARLAHPAVRVWRHGGLDRGAHRWICARDCCCGTFKTPGFTIFSWLPQ